MNRGTDLALIAEAKLDSINEAHGPVQISIETVGKLVVPKNGNGPVLYLPDLDALTSTIESIRPTLKALVDIGQQIAGSGLRSLGKRLAQWRKRLNALNAKSSKLSYLTLLEKFLLLSALRVIGQQLAMVRIPQIFGTFVQQVFNSSSLMHTGPPSLSTGLPIKQLVTTWGRVI